jgi:hypothetical protein
LGAFVLSNGGAWRNVGSAFEGFFSNGKGGSIFVGLYERFSSELEEAEVRQIEEVIERFPDSAVNLHVGHSPGSEALLAEIVGRLNANYPGFLIFCGVDFSVDFPGVGKLDLCGDKK